MEDYLKAVKNLSIHKNKIESNEKKLMIYGEKLINPYLFTIVNDTII